MNEDQITHMVKRFLGWTLPETFNPDGGISFKKTFNEHTGFPMRSEPRGTNLLDASQAEIMVRHLLEGFSPTSDEWFSRVVLFLVDRGMLDVREEYDINDVMAALHDNYQPSSALTPAA